MKISQLHGINLKSLEHTILVVGDGEVKHVRLGPGIEREQEMERNAS